ncbi:RHS domain-containing protein (plasmid) [Ralstonia wenshanensis]|uniref:RHS repeat-associated core domain-containing protein n=1 Tax=Ralstonia wenshanensis TaxID=2842456 RepID=UPI002377CF7B|nr:RHS repeat-associated core domain-containing protein [Ralstonia wenshanensis]UGS89370.1 RHS domain-containing protein [Ralstonia wenshanensis]
MKYQYDALGRRITKHAQAVYFEPLGAGSVYIHNERARVNKELGCGFTLYGWDGDTLAWEARRDADIMRQGAYHPSPGSTRTTHYLYEPNSFVPIAQGVTHGMLPLHKQPAYADAEYDIDEDPLWQHEIQPTPFDSLAWYQCDHLGTPQELTDQTGEIAWSAHYKAWGAAQEVISDAARKAGIQNPLRFQGQYFDHETGLHYNRHRYYDPSSGRFISKDPIGLAGGLNVYQYAPNTVQWVDPLGLSWSRPPNLSPEGAGRRGAFRQAKRDNGVPVCMCPTRVGPNLDKRGRVQQGRTYEFDQRDSSGRVSTTVLRDDAGGHDFGLNNSQNRGPHFNDQKEGHYDY